MDNYEKICRDEDRDDNDCTVVAVSISTGIPYKEAARILASAGRKPNKGCSQVIYHAEIRKLGFNIQSIRQEKYGIARLSPDIRHPLIAKTVRTVERELAKNWGGCKVLIGIRRHVLTWDGNEIADWTAGRQHRITSAHLVYKGDHLPEGKSVPAKARKSLRKTARKRSAVIAIVDGVETKHRSVKAAYDHHNLQLQGHQAIRRLVKYWGEYEFTAYTRDGWDLVEITLKLDKE